MYNSSNSVLYKYIITVIVYYTCMCKDSNNVHYKYVNNSNSILYKHV